MNRIISVITALFMLLSSAPAAAFAAGDEPIYRYSVDIEGEVNYDAAREVLVLLNQFRSANGLRELAYDEGLVGTAVERCLEIPLLFSHKRPDGTEWHTISDTVIVNGENIAVGSKTAAGAFNQWETSTQGHRERMLDEDYRSVGIAMVKHNGRCYWVQHFSYTITTKQDTRTGTEMKSKTSTVVEQGMNIILMMGNYPCTETPYELSLGKTVQLTAERTNPNYTRATAVFAPSTFVWSSSDPAVATVDENGLVTAVGSGEATVSAYLADADITLSQTFNVAGDLKDAVASEIPDQVYFGEIPSPEPVITMNGRLLEKDKDYSLSYSGDPASGTGLITAAGLGSVTGTMEIPFNIIPADLSNSGITVIELPEAAEYTGGPITPEPVVTIAGRTLIKGTDYTVSYSGNTEIGTAQVTVTGLGAVTGEAQRTFSITPVDVSSKVTVKVNASAVYNDFDYDDRQAFAEDNVRVTLNKEPLVCGTDYEISSFSFSSEKKLSSVKIEFIGQYGGELELSSIAKAYVPSIADMHYTGSAVVPEISVYKSETAYQRGEEPLKAGTDYYVTCSENEEPGTAELTVTGKGRYFGEVSAVFNIVLTLKLDVDGNGKINMKDVALLQLWLNGADGITIDEFASDVNSDNAVNMKDLALLIRYLNGWDISEFIGKTA